VFKVQGIIRSSGNHWRLCLNGKGTISILVRLSAIVINVRCYELIQYGHRDAPVVGETCTIGSSKYKNLKLEKKEREEKEASPEEVLLSSSPVTCVS
jgi:hypothetical protein